MTKFGAVFAAALLVAVAAANYFTATTLPWHVAGTVIPAGTWFIGAVFVLRDAVQIAYSRRVAYLALAAALAVNFAMSIHYGDLRWITTASACAFLVSGVCDTETFTRMRVGIVSRVLAAGLASGLLDSAIFVTIGLSPLTTGFLTWPDVVRAVLAQVAVKCVVVALGSTAFYRQRLAIAQ